MSGFVVIIAGMHTHIKKVEWAGSILGLAGAFLLALNSPISGWGFVAFLISNLCWVVFAIYRSSFGLLTMQVGFTATSVLGIARWL